MCGIYFMWNRLYPQLCEPIFPDDHTDLNESIHALCTRDYLSMYLLYNIETRTLAYDDLVMNIIIAIAFNDN